MPNIYSQEYKSHTPELHQHLYDIDMMARQQYGVSVEQNPSLPIILFDSNFYEYNLRYVHQPPAERDPRLQELLGADPVDGPVIEDLAIISQTKVDSGYQSQLQTVYRGEHSDEYLASNLRISVNKLATNALRQSRVQKKIFLPDNHVNQFIDDVFELSVDNLYMPVNRHAENFERQALKRRIRSAGKNIFDHHDPNIFTDDKPHVVRYRSGNVRRPVDITLSKQPGFGYSQYQNKAAREFQKISLGLQQDNRRVVFDIRPADLANDMSYATYRKAKQGELEPVINNTNLDFYSEMLFVTNLIERLEDNVTLSSLDTPDSIAELEPLPHLENQGVDKFINRFIY